MNETYTVINPTTGEALVEPEGEDGIIPFADDDGHANGQGDLAQDAFETVNEQEKRVSIVDRDLGLDSQNQMKRRGRFACPCCGQGIKRAMRVRVANGHTAPPRWIALCAVCAASMLARIPGTIVGGMVRPSRRKRLNRVRPTTQTPHGFQPRPDGRYRRAG